MADDSTREDDGATSFADALRAGVAIYNASEHHAAHDAWEHRWLDLEKGTPDERFLHGLIQFTAAIYHARNRNWTGAVGLAESAVEYLDGLPADHRGVNVDAVRGYLRDFRADPERIERGSPLALTYRGEALALGELGFESAAVAAAVLAEEKGYDEEVVERAVEYAHGELRDGTETRFITLVMDFAAGERRPLVFRRMREHVERRRHRETDVEGLFGDEE